MTETTHRSGGAKDTNAIDASATTHIPMMGAASTNPSHTAQTESLCICELPPDVPFCVADICSA